MEVANLSLEYIKVLIFPISLLIVFFFLRKELKALLYGKVSAKYKELSITLERKDAVIASMQDNFREVSQKVEKEIRQLQDKKKWSGFDYKSNRLISALKNIELDSDQHVILSLLRTQGGISSILELVNRIIKPNVHMEAHEFQIEKQRLDVALEGLKQKGLVSASDKGKLKLHPWASQSFDKSAEQND